LNEFMTFLCTLGNRLRTRNTWLWLQNNRSFQQVPEDTSQISFSLYVTPFDAFTNLW